MITVRRHPPPVRRTVPAGGRSFPLSPSSGMLAPLMREHRWLTALLVELTPWNRREPRCEATRRDCGVRCREPALPELPVCWMHDDGDWKATSFQSGKALKAAVDTYVRRKMG